MTFPEFKGTKGEWVFGISKHTPIRGKIGIRYFVFAPVSNIDNRERNERFIFNQYHDKTEDTEFHNEAEANARLIGAAPSLLKALQLALSTPHNEWDGIKQKICFDALEKALGTPIINPRPEGTPYAF